MTDYHPIEEIQPADDQGPTGSGVEATGLQLGPAQHQQSLRRRATGHYRETQR